MWGFLITKQAYTSKTQQLKYNFECPAVPGLCCSLSEVVLITFLMWYFTEFIDLCTNIKQDLFFFSCPAEGHSC